MKRKVGMFLIFAAALPLAATSIAWACGVLATAKLDKTVAAPGEAVTLTGNNYSTSATASAVTIRLNTRSGQVLGAPFAPDPSGRINSTFNLPANLRSGWYVINVLQFNGNGTPKAGTPGRTTLRVQGSAVAAATPWGNSAPSGPSATQLTVDAGSGSLAPMLAAIALSLTMLAGGWTLVARKGRSASSTPLAT